MLPIKERREGRELVNSLDSGVVAGIPTAYRGWYFLPAQVDPRLPDVEVYAHTQTPPAHA